MSLRTRIRISIVALAAVVVVILSLLYLYDFTRLVFEGAHARALLVANEVKDYVAERVDEEIAARNLHPTTADQFRDAAADIIRTDARVANQLRASRASYDAVLNIEIAGPSGVLVAADPAPVAASILPTHDFEVLNRRNAFRNLFDLFSLREDYATTIPLSVLGVAPPTQPSFTIKVILQSVLLSKVLEPAFYKLAAGFFSALAGAMFLAALLPNLFLTPLERVSKRIESISAGETVEPEPAPRGEAREFAAVQSKLNVLGQQFRGAKQDAIDLRRNVEQLLERLEEAVLLFDSAGHLMMAGHSVERLLGLRPQELAGRTVEQVFTPANGEQIADVVRLRRPWREQMVTLRNTAGADVHAIVSAEPLENAYGGNMGTMITLRDAETRRQLEMQLGVSSRLAAPSRPTTGGGHQVKKTPNSPDL